MLAHCQIQTIFVFQNFKKQLNSGDGIVCVSIYIYMVIWSVLLPHCTSLSLICCPHCQ
jgi:hypothetical protein